MLANIKDILLDPITHQQYDNELLNNIKIQQQKAANAETEKEYAAAVVVTIDALLNEDLNFYEKLDLDIKVKAT